MHKITCVGIKQLQSGHITKKTSKKKFHQRLMDIRQGIPATGILVYVLVVSLFISGCSLPVNTAEKTVTPIPTQLEEVEEPITTPTVFITRLELFPDKYLQTLKDVGGGNFIHRYGGTNSPLDPVSELNIKMLSPSIARVSIDLDIWEPENDNEDPYTFSPEAFSDEPGTIVHDTFEFMQVFQKNQPVETDEKQIIIASIWYVPDWMVANPGDDRARMIPDEMVPEVIESITAWLLLARDQYGINVDFVSFNEANLGVNVLLNGDAYASLIIQAGKRFAESGLSTRWLLADASNMSETSSYARRIFSNPETHPYLGPLSFHSWDMTASDGALTKIADFAQENNLETWCTEGGWNPNLWQTSEDFPSFRNALNQAVVYSRVLKLTGASALIYWEMMGADYSMNDGSQPYPILSFMAELKKQFPPGAKIIETSKDRQSIKFVAAEVNGEIVVMIVNRNPIEENALLAGLPEGEYHLIRFDKTGMNQEITTYEITSDDLEFVIAPSSINFLTKQP